MPEPGALALFFGASLALLVTPGPAVLYVVGRSVDQGPRAGFISALGLVSGGIVHLAAAVLGISALLAATPAALAFLGWAGAAYLAWLGVSELRAGPEPSREDGAAPPAASGSQIFRQGVMVNVLNPKSVLFFMAFLPQFVRPDGLDPRVQVLALGAAFLTVALCTDSAWALAAGRLGAPLRRPRYQRIRRLVSAAIYFALAVGAAWPR